LVRIQYSSLAVWRQFLEPDATPQVPTTGPVDLAFTPAVLAKALWMKRPIVHGEIHEFVISLTTIAAREYDGVAIGRPSAVVVTPHVTRLAVR
jgi:hypothetical protein